MFSAKIIRIVQRSPTVSTFYFNWDNPVQPGQFLMVWIPGKGEIPMSVSHLEEEKAITVKSYGPASAELLKLSVGERVYFRGPFGRPFSRVNGKRLIIGAGSGMASLHPLISKNTYALISARSKEEILFDDEFDEEHLTITTDDGSYGIKGNFLEGLKTLDLNKFDMLYACGPEVMLFALYRYLKGKPVRAELSLERMMKCGISLCDSCSINGFQLCRDGPIFTLEEIDKMTEFGTEKLTAAGKRVKIA